MKRPPLLPTHPLRDLRQLVFDAEERKGNRPAIKSKKDGKWQAINYCQLRERVGYLATFYSELGLKKGDRVSVLSQNRTEWCVAYLAAVCSGVVAVPIDRDLKPREIKHILNFAESRVLVCGGDYLNPLSGVKDDVPTLVSVISMDEPIGDADITYQQSLKQGKKASRSNRFFEEAVVDSQDLAAIIFTSGTTGSSKGVMLTHGNIAADIVKTSQHVSVADEHDVMLSVLPLHHTYECTGGFLMALYQGSLVCHAENLRRIPENMAQTKTTIMLGVPLLFEAFYRRIEEGMRKKGERKVRMAKRIASFTEKFGLNIRKRIFKEVHKRFGGRLRLLISGGAAIDPAVSKGFRELGIDFIQGYGMTEASPIIAVNRINYFKDAAVGPPLDGVEIKIQDGEILARGEIVMPGYYQNPEATGETIRDGWLHTGDLGYLDEDGFLFINGRKKSVIVTPNGKNVYPEEIEAQLNQSPFVLESLVWGGPQDDPLQVEVQAIIVPDSEAFDQEYGAAGYGEEKIRRKINGEVKRICSEMANYKKVKKFTLRQAEFEKTTTKKIKRYLYTGKQQSVPSEEAPENQVAAGS